MKIKQRLAILISALTVGAVGITSLLTLRFVHSATIAHEVQEMKIRTQEIEKKIQVLHAKASEDIAFAVRNSLFTKYFSLPETRAGNRYRNGVIQFTPRQRQVKSQLEDWISQFRSKFEVDEACLIDKSGQEHIRLFENKIEPDAKLSSHEAQEPFFAASFDKASGEVHIEYPYVSSDTGRWVFAYTSPIELGNGEKPAFFHFEMPVKLFQDVLSARLGRMAVIDPRDFLIADTMYYFPTVNVSSNFSEYFAPAEIISKATGFARLLQRIKVEKGGYDTYPEDGEIFHVVFRRLETFDWILAYIVPQSEMMADGDFSVNDLMILTALIAGTVIVLTVTTVFFFVSRMTQPITRLRDVTKRIAQGDLNNDIAIEGADEIRELSQSLATMTKSLGKMIELEKRLAISEKEWKETKLTTMGSMTARFAHDIRNLLSTIKTAVELIKNKTIDMDPRTAEQHERLDRAVQKMTFQVNNVMDFVRTTPLHMAYHAIEDIVDSSMRDIEVPEGISVHISNGELRAKCDRQGLEIVMTNLIKNAIEAIGSEGRIDISAREEGDKLFIEVEDSGPGIADELLPRIFEPLYTTKQEGTGLGLLSCRSIIERHNGSIDVLNHPTRFVIELPRGKGELG